MKNQISKNVWIAYSIFNTTDQHRTQGHVVKVIHQGSIARAYKEHDELFIYNDYVIDRDINLNDLKERIAIALL